MAEEQLPSLGKVIPVELETEMRRSYLDYAMSVIVDRALPDVRDGLKPVQRRILYAMHELNLRPDRPHKKSAAIVGEVMGKYHPHGDAPIYDALVRMAQDFSYRYPLVDGHGNFGCFTGDTRVKLADGTEKTFEELAALGPDARFFVYAVDPATQRIVIAEARNARLTRRAAPLVEVVLDNGNTIRCTPDHRFMLWDGTYKEAQHLQPGDSLMAAYFDEAPVRGTRSTYLRVRHPDGTWEFVHHLADEYNVRNGSVRHVKGPYVRHHVNFNRYDNRPDNVVRVTWREHRRIHAEHLRRLWRDEQFRRRQREGAQRYYTSNPHARELRRLRMSAMNRSPEYKQRQAARRSAILKALFRNDPALRARISQRMRSLWQEPEFRRRMSQALRGLQKKPLSPEVREYVRRRLSASSRSMWANEAKRREIVTAVREAMRRPEVRARVSAGVKACWQKPEYRLRFSSAHFRELARQLWDLGTGIRERHREKVLRQWRDPEFRRIQAEAVRHSNHRRMAQDPMMMRRLTTLAAAQLAVRWRDPEYRYRVMRRKIGRYVSLLLNRYGREGFSPELYERERREPWIPSFPKALTYFGDVATLLEFADKFNHRVVAVRPLPERADVYDITVDLYHNFLLAAGVFVHNSVDGDPPAAMRYTEARLSALAMEMLRDIERETVDFVPNYDNTQKQPVVLPARVPNLLINGASGIAVGMATNIPPHNLGEIVDALVLLIDRPDCSDQELLAVVRGPDFPTGAIILGTEGIREAYLTGRGHLRVRARVQMEPMGGGRTRIVVTELPYMVNKAALIEKIADLVRERRIDGISEVRDESDREGMRIAIELRRDAQPQVVLNRLFKHTPLEDTYGVILLALVDGQPQVLTLRQALRHYLDFQVEVVTRRTRFDLARARERLHIVEGLRIALDHIDEVVALIRSARDEQSARQGLMERFGLSERQAEAILQMQLRRLTGLERGKLDEEYRELQRTIQELTAILEDRARLYGLIRKELLEVKERFADARRTEILPEAPQVEEDDLVALEDIVITLTHNGYIKRQPTSTYRSQRRGGRGVAAMSTRDEDFVEHLFIATTHTQVLLFTDRGKMYHVKGREIPEASRSARGTSILNLLPMSPDESVAAAIAVASFDEGRYLFMATRNGVVKKTPLSEFASVRQGIIACQLDPEDRLVGVRLTGGHQEVLLVTRQGQAVRFPEEQVRPMGRAARGVRGIRLEEGDEVVAMDAVRPGADVLLVTEQGFGKRTPVDQFRLTGRGGKGVRAMQLSERTGPLVGMRVVEDDDEVMLISARGVMIRLRAREVTRQGRQARGVTLMRLDEGDVVTAVAQVAAARDGEPEGEEAPE